MKDLLFEGVAFLSKDLPFSKDLFFFEGLAFRRGISCFSKDFRF